MTRNVQRAGLEDSVCSALDHLVGSWLISRKVGGHFVVNLAKQAGKSALVLFYLINSCVQYEVLVI